jgi:dihydrofolate reductase
MTIAIIVAMTRNRVIGKEGRIPWRDPEDLQHFKRLTTGHAVIMGRKTFESIGRPLANRRNIIISRSDDAAALLARQPGFSPGAAPTQGPQSVTGLTTSFNVVRSPAEAVELCRRRSEERVFIIGGAQIYEQMLPIADEMIITEIDADEITGDACFPEWNLSQWTRLPEPDRAFPRAVTYQRVKPIRRSERGREDRPVRPPAECGD